MVELFVNNQDERDEHGLALPHLFIHDDASGVGDFRQVRIDADTVRSDPFHPFARLVLDALTRGNFSAEEEEAFRRQSAVAFGHLAMYDGEDLLEIQRSKRDAPFALLVNGKPTDSFKINPGDHVVLRFIE